MANPASPRLPQGPGRAVRQVGVGLMMHEVWLVWARVQGPQRRHRRSALRVPTRALQASPMLTAELRAQDGPDKVIRIKGCMRGSAAAQHGNVLAGDVLVAVDGKATRDLTIDSVRNLVVGPEGEMVQIRLRRGHGTPAPTEVVVDLMRGAPEARQPRGGLGDFIPSDVNSADPDDWWAPHVGGAGALNGGWGHAHVYSRADARSAPRFGVAPLH